MCGGQNNTDCCISAVFLLIFCYKLKLIVFFLSYVTFFCYFCSIIWEFSQKTAPQKTEIPSVKMKMRR